MKYINQLQHDLALRQAAMERAGEAIMDLAQYLDSDKFRSGDELVGYVNVEDVKRYLIIIKDRLYSESGNYKVQ